MYVKDFYYDLPVELIAQTPLLDRTASRLLKLGKISGEIEHRNFTDLVEFLKPGDCLVLNNTRVIPARLIGIKEDTGGTIEFVLLKRIEGQVWEVMVKPGRRAKIGAVFSFGGGLLRAKVLEIVDGGNRRVLFMCDGIFEEVLDKIGMIPLPPYITEKLSDPERYQTVYSKESGSAAAPTAGLHFTEEFLGKIIEMGVKVLYLTLHVGLGTFRPVKVDTIEDHHMHEEYYEIDEETCRLINEARHNGNRVFAVGTTSCRVLESVSNEEGLIVPKSGWTSIFIYPGYKFKVVDALITNFHLPESTLLMLVSSMAGRENILNAYKQAIVEHYRFFSFGDAMIIV